MFKFTQSIRRFSLSTAQKQNKLWSAMVRPLCGTEEAPLSTFVDNDAKAFLFVNVASE